jgi:hypothetical protein
MNQPDIEEIILEIAQIIDSGEVVYLHHTTYEILSYPAPDSSNDEYDYLRQEVYDVVDMDPDSYIKFEPLDSNEGHDMMDAFADTIQNEPLKELIKSALNGKRPFRAFREMIASKDLEEDWYEFKDAYLSMVVRDKITDIA